MEEQRCRAGALRGQRSLRDVYTGFALGLPLVGAKIFQATNGSLDPKGIYKSRSDRPTRSGTGRQASLFPEIWI